MSIMIDPVQDQLIIRIYVDFFLINFYKRNNFFYKILASSTWIQVELWAKTAAEVDDILHGLRISPYSH